jgi:hypothetical protein
MSMNTVISVNLVLALTVLCCSCSQNHSDKPAAEALAERGLRAVAGTAPTDGPAAAEAIVGEYGAPDASDNPEHPTRQQLANVTVVVPEGWQSVPPSSSMRAAEFVLPSSGDGDKATVAIFAGNMGSVEDNIARWKGQFEGVEGSAPESATSVIVVSAEPRITATIVDVSGTFAGGMGPNAGTRQDNQRMLGAIVDLGDETARSRFLYVKLVGPRGTVSRWASSFNEFISSISRA